MIDVAALLEESLFVIRNKVQIAPKVGLVLGSGLGGFADTLADLQKVAYADVPNFASSAVVGHAGNLCFGKSDGVPVVCMQGRVHSYEGHPAWQVVHGVRTMARLGVSAVLITNAAGGVDLSFAPGDLMLIEDHLNLTGQTPLLGPNDDSLGPRFPDLTVAYDEGLREAALAVASAQGVKLQRGVYAGLLGPTYETPAEVRMVRSPRGSRGRDEHRARDDRAPPSRRAGRRALLHHQCGGGDLGREARSQGGRGSCP